MITRERIELILGSILTLSTLAVAVVVIEQRFRPAMVGAGGVRIEALDDWDARSAAARTPLSSAEGGVRVDVFTDFECPFCRALDSVLQVTERKYPEKLSRSLIHYPLSIHEGARRAAEAFECASLAGRGLQMSTALFAVRSLATARMDSLAVAVGVADTARFLRCLKATSETAPRIDAGLALASELALRSTPTVIVNGWIIDPAQPASIVRAIERALAGKKPSP